MFPKSPGYKYVPYDIRKERERHHVSQPTTLGAPPPLILGFHPSKRHATLIGNCDQGSVVLAFTLVLLVLKRFLWRVMIVILMFIAWLLVDPFVLSSLIIYEYHVVSVQSHFNLMLVLVA